MRITKRQLRRIVREVAEIVHAGTPAIEAAYDEEMDEEDPRHAEDRWERREEELYESLRCSLRRALIKEQHKVGGDMPRDMFNPGQPPLEITEPGVTREQISDAWPNVIYKGQDVMDLMYDDRTIASAEDAITDITGEDRFEGQEAYLAWIPSKDIFVMGFDVFQDHGMTSGIVELDPRGRVLGADTGGSGMYGRGGGREQVQKMYPDRLELRLD